MDDIQILVVHSKGVYNVMGLIRWHSSLSLFCYHAFFSIFKKTFIGFALRLFRTKGYSFKSGTSFVERAVNGETKAALTLARIWVCALTRIVA